jgi:hypothetical protein
LVSFCHCKKKEEGRRKKEEGRRKKEERLVLRLCLGTHIREALPRIVNLGNKRRRKKEEGSSASLRVKRGKKEEARNTRFQALPGNAYRRGSASNCQLRKHWRKNEKD